MLSAVSGQTPDRLLGLYYLGVLVVPTALFRDLRMLSPFFQTGSPRLT